MEVNHESKRMPGSGALAPDHSTERSSMDGSGTRVQGGTDDLAVVPQELHPGVAEKGRKAAGKTARDRGTRNLGAYVSELEAVCEAIEFADDIDEEIIARFDDAKAGMEGKVDRFLGFLDAMELKIADTKRIAAMFTEEVRKLQRLEKGLKGYLTDLVLQSPDLPWEGTLEKVRAQKNSQASLITEAEFGTRSLSDIVFPSHLQIAPELMEFVTEEKFFVLNKDKIKTALAAGQKVPFCDLKQGYHTRRKLK